jgi:hypothetical protein
MQSSSLHYRQLATLLRSALQLALAALALLNVPNAGQAMLHMILNVHYMYMASRQHMTIKACVHVSACI